MLEARHAAEVVERYSLGSGGVLSGPVARGELGRVWRLETSIGSWAVKESFEALRETDVGEEADYQDMIKAGGVPAPAVIRTVDGDVLAALDDAQIRVYEWVDLRDPDINLDAVAVGDVVASIHRLRHARAGRIDPWYVDPVGSDRWDELVSMVATVAAPFADELVSARDELVALEELLEPPSQLQACHRDLWADNVRGTPEGDLCVIDWENCGPADPNQELALVLFEFAGDDAQRARDLYDAYRDRGAPGRVDNCGDFSMTIAQLGHIRERLCRIWLDPGSSELDRGRAERGIEELDARPLTRRVIERMLDVVRR